MYKDTWDVKTRKGRKRVEALLEIIKRIKYREDVREEVNKNPIFRGVRHNSINQQLNREAGSTPLTPLGKAWSKLPNRPNRVASLFPDAKRREEFAEDLKKLKISNLRQKYQELKGLTSDQINKIAGTLNIERTDIPRTPTKHPANRNWTLNLVPELQQKFIERFRSDYRIPGNTNRDLQEEWGPHGCTSEEILKIGAQALGETRNRPQIVSKDKTAEQIDRAIEQQMQEIIAGGILVTLGIDHLYEQIKTELAEDLENSKFNLTREYFDKKVDKIVWTEGKAGTLTVLQNFIEKGLGPEKFQEYHRHIPLAMVLVKATELTGSTNIKNPPPFSSASFAAGIGRLLGGDDIPEEELRNFRLPEINFNRPLEVSFIDPKNFKMGVINGANLGILHTPIIENNTVRQAMAYAKRRGYAALILTGLFDLDTTKAEGHIKGIRALYSGRNTNVDVLDPGYQEEARRIITAIEANELTNEIIYETAKEGALNLLRGWWKVTLVDKEPEFPGPVYVVLGPKEFDMISSAAHSEVLYITLSKQAELREESSAAISAVKRAEKQLKALEDDLTKNERLLAQTEIQEEQENLRETINHLRQQTEAQKQESVSLRQRFIELKKQEARTRMTNIRPEDWQRFMKMSLALISVLIERAIPNCKVISLGTTYIKVGPKPKDKIKIVIPGHLKVTDTLLSDYTNTYAPEALSLAMAETIIICHPHAIAHAMTAREVDSMGRRGYAPRIHAAPILLDGKFIRSKTEQIIRRSHPLGQVVNHPFFQGGILEIEATDGMINVSPVKVETLGNYERPESPTRINTKTVKPALANTYIWAMAATDQHWGGRAKEFLFDEESGKSLGMAEAAFHLMRKAGYNDKDKLPPFHMFVVNDDPTQGHHFPAEKEPHRHEMQYYEFEKEQNMLYEKLHASKSPRERAKIEVQIRSMSRRQVRVRGTDSYTRQMQAFIRCHIRENIDMFSGMLRRSHNAELILKPISEFEDFLEAPYDTCDLGLINEGTGNHGLGTTDDNLSEGVIHAEVMIPYLMTRPYWNDKVELLERYVKGPVFGNKFIALGTLKAPGGYEYAFDLRNTPAANGIDWGDPVRVGARVALRRGNYSRIFENKFIVKMYGDKHFLAWLLTALWAEFMAPAGTHTDAYGERGFPPNNSGVAFIGLPAEGPESGPILIRPLLVHNLRDYIEKNHRPFPWEEFLPNAL